MSVVVLGSANLDIVYRMRALPAPGETTIASSVARNAGGKGGNQAIAVSRSGAATAFLGALGDDEAAELLRGELERAGVAVEHVRTVDAPTGSAVIWVDDDAENSIVVHSGANGLLLDLEDHERATLRAASWLVLQFESPMPTVVDAARTARAAGARVVVNASPLAPLPADLVETIDVLIVNEQEAVGVLDGLGLAHGGENEPRANAVALSAVFPAVIVTAGSRGAVHVDADGVVEVAAHRVKAVDTTGAGDTFCGAFVAARDRGLGAREALEYASAASALAVQTAGAVPSIPARAAVEEFLARGQAPA